jgi:hypothetical protein
MWVVEPVEKRSVSESTTYKKEIDGTVYTIHTDIGFRWGKIYFTDKPDLNEASTECFNMYEIGNVDEFDFSSDTTSEDVRGIEDLPDEEQELLEENDYFFTDCGWDDVRFSIHACGPFVIYEM